MDVELIRLGMLVVAVVMICGGVYLAVKSPFFYAAGEFIALSLVMFSAAGLGLYASIMLGRIVPLLVGILLSAPCVIVCRYRLVQVFKELKKMPPLWS